MVEKIVYDPPAGIAQPGEMVRFSFAIANTGINTATVVSLRDTYDTACLRFVPTGIGDGRDPDDPADDGELNWSRWVVGAISAQKPGANLAGGPVRGQGGPSARPPRTSLNRPRAASTSSVACFPGCQATVNHLEVVAADPEGRRTTGADDETVHIMTEGLPDLGDAPARLNHAGRPMTAYPIGGPPGVFGQFPTVYDPALGALGPIHWQPRGGAWLGKRVTRERNADLGPDEDGVTNIMPADDAPDLDAADDGLQLPLQLAHCTETNFKFTVTFPAGGPQEYFLNAWFDWDRNGQWGGFVRVPSWPGQPGMGVRNMVIARPPAGAGTYSFTSPAFVAWNPDPDHPLWLRLTLSEQPTQQSDGSGPLIGYEYGETEDYYLGLRPPTPTPTASPTQGPTATATRDADAHRIPHATGHDDANTDTHGPASPTRPATATSTRTPTREPGCEHCVYLPLILRSYPLIFHDNFNDGTLTAGQLTAARGRIPAASCAGRTCSTRAGTSARRPGRTSAMRGT